MVERQARDVEVWVRVLVQVLIFLLKCDNVLKYHLAMVRHNCLLLFRQKFFGTICACKPVGGGCFKMLESHSFLRYLQVLKTINAPRLILPDPTWQAWG